MQYLHDVYDVLERSTKALPQSQKEEEAAWRLRDAFKSNFERTAQMITRMRADPVNADQKGDLDIQQEYLAQSAVAFMGENSAGVWAPYNAEEILNHDILNDQQKDRLQHAFERALKRTFVEDHKSLTSIYWNTHQISEETRYTQAFVNVLRDNFGRLFSQHPAMALTFATVLAHRAAEEGDKLAMVALFSEYAAKYERPFIRMNDATWDPVLRFLFWNCNTEHKDLAMQIAEEHLAKMSINVKTHKKIRYNPSVIVMSGPEDDLKYDSFAAIYEMVLFSDEDQHESILKLAHQLFLREFDVIAARSPSKSFEFAMILNSKLYSKIISDRAQALHPVAEEFRRSIVSRVATEIVGRVDKVRFEYNDVDPATWVLARAYDNENLEDVAMERLRERWNKPSMTAEEYEYNKQWMMYAIELLGRRENSKTEHRFLRELCGYLHDDVREQAAQGNMEGVSGLITMACYVNGRGALRYNMLQLAKTMTDSICDDDPLLAEDHYQKISELCQTKREVSQIKETIEKVMPSLSKSHRMTTGEQARFDSVLSRFDI